MLLQELSKTNPDMNNFILWLSNQHKIRIYIYNNAVTEGILDIQIES